MTWTIDGPQGFESQKVRFDVLPYCHTGIDVGCGALKVWPHLIGIDSGKDTALYGTAMKPDIVVADAAKLSLFADRSMQSVFSSHTLEHIEDYRAALAEWWRLVREGGHLVLYLPHAELYPRRGQPGANPDHKHDFLPSDIIETMEGIAADWSLIENQTRDAGHEYSFLLVFRREPEGTGHRFPWLIPPAEKRAAIVRVGGHGDALWASSPAKLLKEQGYHVSVYTACTGAEILRHDPHIDRIIELPTAAMTEEELLEYWGHEGRKYDRFHNLIGSVEDTLLWHPSHIAFYRPQKLRHRLANVNYLERVHDFCDLPHVFAQRHYPTAHEQAWAQRMRAELPGPLVVIAPAGSGAVKYWPHSQRLMEGLAEHGIYSVVLGDVRDPGVVGLEPFGSVIGMDWPVRLALAFTLLADAVVATESLVANAAAMEPMLKLVTLSHSSNENLTKHWKNTIAFEPGGVSCHPCHRIHSSFDFCARDKRTGAAACQAVVTAETVLEVLRDRLPPMFCASELMEAV